MKKKNILNRPMFKQVKSPAYGTGISANLVSGEERQRYNRGGRIGFKDLGYAVPWQIKEGNRIYDQYYNELNKAQLGPYGYEVAPEYGTYKVKEWEDLSGTEELPGIGELQFSDYYDRGDYTPYKVGTASKDPDVIGSSTRDIVARGAIAPERKGSFEDLSMQELLKEQAGEKGDVWIDEQGKKLQPTTDEEIIKRKSMIEEASPVVTAKDDKWRPGVEHSGLSGDEIAPSGMPQPPKFEETETLDIAGIVDKYYDKKASLGAAQLGLAGQVLKAGFQPKKDAMGTVGDAMGQFGKDIQKDKQTFEKLAATGEIQRELYRMSRAEEGKQDRQTKEYDTKLKKWLKDNGAEEDDISDVENYTGLIYGWDQGKRGEMTGHQHQDLIARFDEEFATDSIVISPTTTGIGKDKVTSLTDFDQTQLNKANEGDTIIIGADIFVKDSSAPGQMRKVNYTQIKLSKKKKKKPFKRFN